MTKKEKFEVAVAAFEALLGKNKLWVEYMKNFNHRRLHGVSQEIYSDWKAWASFTPKHEWLDSAFVWDETPEGRSKWKSLDYAWLKWVCKNLNK